MRKVSQQIDKGKRSPEVEPHTQYCHSYKPLDVGQQFRHHIILEWIVHTGWCWEPC